MIFSLTTDVLEYMLTPLNQLGVLKSNHRFITDADLCYYCYKPHGGDRIRGILQTYKQDGSVLEKDIEYGFD